MSAPTVGAPQRPGPALGTVTRGTTAPYRLRRLDRWLLASRPGLVRTRGLHVVDLGFGASPVTTVELCRRLVAVNPTARVTGLDLDPQRVAAARPAGRSLPVAFARGGFELAGLRPHVVRAANVLRQYPPDEVAHWWAELTARVAPGGLVVDATVDEAGRLGAWIALDRRGPLSLTLAVDLAGTSSPGAVAARLPKALIHRNVPGEPVHALLATLDRAWAQAAPLAAFGARQRFAAAVAGLRAAGVPVLDGPGRWRRGEVTVGWSAVAPGPR